MLVKLFQPRFAPLVRDRIKRQTVRPMPKRMPKVGEEFSGRMWSGLPYRSKQIELVRSKVTKVVCIDITETGIALNSMAEPCDAFAQADGFGDFLDLLVWFQSTHSLPFEGIVIYWE